VRDRTYISPSLQRAPLIPPPHHLIFIFVVITRYPTHAFLRKSVPLTPVSRTVLLRTASHNPCEPHRELNNLTHNRNRNLLSYHQSRIPDPLLALVLHPRPHPHHHLRHHLLSPPHTISSPPGSGEISSAAANIGAPGSIISGMRTILFLFQLARNQGPRPGWSSHVQAREQWLGSYPRRKVRKWRWWMEEV